MIPGGRDLIVHTGQCQLTLKFARGGPAQQVTHGQLVMVPGQVHRLQVGKTVDLTTHDLKSIIRKIEIQSKDQVGIKPVFADQIHCIPGTG